MQVEDCKDHHQHVAFARYAENLSIAEAYSDPRLQPAVVMKKLRDARYFATMTFFKPEWQCELFALQSCISTTKALLHKRNRLIRDRHL